MLLQLLHLSIEKLLLLQLQAERELEREPEDVAYNIDDMCRCGHPSSIFRDGSLHQPILRTHRIGAMSRVGASSRGGKTVAIHRTFSGRV